MHPWDEYLSKLTNRRLAASVRAFVVATGLPVPTAIPLDDGTMHLAWDCGEHHFDVDISESGRLEWFYLNRITSESVGTEDPTDSIDAEARRYLDRVRPCDGTCAGNELGDCSHDRG